MFDQPWPETVERWRGEGLPSDTTVGDYFDFDIVQIGADLSPRMPYELLEEDDEYIVERTTYGTVWKRHRRSPSVLHTLEYPIACRADWFKLKGRFLPDPGRVAWDVATRRLRFPRTSFRTQ